MEEEWRNAYRIDGYQVSNFGGIRSVDRYIITKNGIKVHRRGKVLKTSTNKQGYKMFFIEAGGKRTCHRVHNVVYNTFVKEIPKGKEIDHIDRNPANNTLYNLRLVDRRENCYNRSNALKHTNVRRLCKNYSVSIYWNGTRYYLGTEPTEEKAYNVYLKAKEAIKNGTFNSFYQSRKFNKIKGLPTHIFYRRKRGTYTASVKNVHIAESKDLEMVKQKLKEYLDRHE